MPRVDYAGGSIDFPEGTPEKEMLNAVAVADMRHKLESGQKLNIGQAGFKEAAQQVSDDTGMAGRFIAGAGRALDEPAMGLKQLVQGLTPEEELNLRQARELESTLGAAGTAGRIAGDVGLGYGTGGAGLARGLTSGAKMLPGALAKKAAPYAGAAGMGAAYGAINPTLDDQTRLGGAGVGAAGGALGELGGRVLHRALTKPILTSPEASRMIERGVQPTIGQAANRDTLFGKTLHTAESALTGVPGLGSVIEGGRRRTVREGIDDIFKDTSPADLKKIPGWDKMSGWEKVSKLKERFGELYSAATKNVEYKPTREFEEQLTRIVHDPATGLSPTQRETLGAHLQDILYNQFRAGAPPRGSIIIPGQEAVQQPARVTGEMLQRAESDLGAAARKWRASSTQQDRAMGEAYEKASKALGDMRRAQTPQELRGVLDNVDKLYAQFKRLETAAGSAGAASALGDFTPSQLMLAIRQLEPSKGKFAAGGSLMQQKAGDLAAVTKGQLGESGTMPRLAWGALMGGAASMAGLLPHLAGMAAGGSALYSKPVQKYLTGSYKAQRALEPRLRAFLQKYRPGALGGRNLIKQGDGNAEEQ